VCQLRNVVSCGAETRKQKRSTILKILDVGHVNTFQDSRLEMIDEWIQLRTSSEVEDQLILICGPA